MPAYERSRRLLGRLLDGPSSRYYEPVIPSGVSLRGLYILDGEAVVDFSKEITTNLKGGAGRELLTAYAVANTLLLNVREIHRVRILIDGRQCDTLSGEVDLRLPLGPNAGMIQW
ncbi:MAG TPA: GerMN domain-containing protein [Candidatus Sumerlaeota bacterium]|nr:GerMN domain-containing protein [Candidatus Sumerlaeota bacterium]